MTQGRSSFGPPASGPLPTPEAGERSGNIKLAIVADIRLYREGLALILARHPGIHVVATAASTNGSLGALADLAPDLVLIDVAMPDSLAAIRRVVGAAPGARVVTLGVGEGDHEIVASAEAGAIGHVPREGSLQDLVAVIERAARGEAICSPRIAGALLRRVATLATDRSVNQVHRRGEAAARVRGALPPRPTEHRAIH